MKLQPTQDWMILKKAEYKTDLALPDIANMMSDMGDYEVLAIGPWDTIPYNNNTSRVHNVAVGDTVIIEGLNAPTFQFNGQDYYAARARNVCYIVKGGSDGETD